MGTGTTIDDCLHFSDWGDMEDDEEEVLEDEEELEEEEDKLHDDEEDEEVAHNKATPPLVELSVDWLLMTIGSLFSRTTAVSSGFVSITTLFSFSNVILTTGQISALSEGIWLFVFSFGDTLS